MKKEVRPWADKVVVLALGAMILGSAGNAATPEIPSDLGLPQICEYLPPHAGFGTVSIKKNDGHSIKVTGLQGVDGPILLYYNGKFEDNGQHIFMKSNNGLPPEVKLLKDGGDTVFYGNLWGYGVHCDVANNND